MQQHPVCSDLLSNHPTHLLLPMLHSDLLSNHPTHLLLPMLHSDLLINHPTHLLLPLLHSDLLSNHIRKCFPRLVQHRTFINKEQIEALPPLRASLTVLVTAVSLSHLHHQCLTPIQILATSQIPATSLSGMPLRLALREFQTTLEDLPHTLVFLPCSECLECSLHMLSMVHHHHSSASVSNASQLGHASLQRS